MSRYRNNGVLNFIHQELAAFCPNICLNGYGHFSSQRFLFNRFRLGRAVHTWKNLQIKSLEASAVTIWQVDKIHGENLLRARTILS